MELTSLLSISFPSLLELALFVLGTFLVVQWLRPGAPNAGGTGVIPGQGIKIPHAKKTYKR